jgi:hypothetical protein
MRFLPLPASRYPLPILGCLLLALAVGLPSGSSAQQPAAQGSWKAERSKRGDTTVVRTVSGSVWGDKVSLVEELRIGSKEGDGVDAFGAIHGLAVLPTGAVAVFDGSVPALRLFSPEGTHLRTLGRDGAGPGEYRNQTLGLAVDRDGVLLMYDPRNARLNRWKEDGTVLPSWRAPGRLYTNQALQVDTGGGTWVRITTEAIEPGKPWKFGLLRVGPEGVPGDTLHPPPIAGEAPANATFFEPQKYWHRNRNGEWVTGFGGAYAITMGSSGRGALRVERSVPRIPVAAEERRNYQEVAEALRRSPNRAQSGPVTVPSQKPYFRGIESDLDGRIWVDLHGPGETFEPAPRPVQPGAPSVPPLRWRERRRYDVFGRDGSYLGRIELPPRTTLSEAKGNRVWAIQRGEDDEQYIIRYRIAGTKP